MERQRARPVDVESDKEEKPRTSYQAKLGEYRREIKELMQDLEFSRLLKAIIEFQADTGIIEGEMDEEDEDGGLEEVETIPAPIPIEKPVSAPPLSLEEQQYGSLVQFHSWLVETRYEFMFNAPPVKKSTHYQEWEEEWSKVLFDYSRITHKHVVYVSELLKTEPFSKLRSRQKLVLEIADCLIQKKLAAWLKKKEKLRVYWKSIDEWAELIYKWAYNNVITDPQFIYDLKECGEEFSDLPDEDFEDIFKTLERSRRGRLVKSGGKVAFIFELT